MNEPLLTALSYSGGKQSTVLLDMVLRGEIEMPKHLVVLNADPGMENEESYSAVGEMKKRCAEARIPFLSAQTTLFHDLVTSDMDEGSASGPWDGQTFVLRGNTYRLGSHDYEACGDETVCTARVYAE